MHVYLQWITSIYHMYYNPHISEWTTDGCVTDLAEVNESVVTCYCNHLTNFAILVVSFLFFVQYVHK